jgi:NADH-quinone oxidoreductase subunit L
MAGYLALAGFPFLFSGFWSKDEILAHAFDRNDTLGYIVWGVLTVASFLTAFYMTRQVWVVFFGNFRGHSPRVTTHPSEPVAVEHAHGDAHGHVEHAAGGEHAVGGHDPHESPWTMTAPLIILAVFAVLGGFINLPFERLHNLSTFFQQEAGNLNLIVMSIAIVVALGGMGLGWWVYRDAFATAADLDPLERMMPSIFRALNRKLYFDELYANTFGKLSYGLAIAWNWLDRRVFDGVINGTGLLTLLWGRVNFIIDDTLLNDGADLLSEGTNVAGDGARQAETGKIQDYVSLVFAGVVVIGIIYLYAFRK